MNIEHMKKYFEEQKVPEWYYVIDELGGGEVDGIGCIDGRWATYYSERGEKRNIKFYGTEDEACEALIALVSDRVEEEIDESLPKV